MRSFQRQIADLAVQRRLPSMYQSRAAVEAGCLMSYGPSGRGGGQQIATYVDKILRGATPAELPVEQVMQIDFVINLKTAQALELTLPPVVLFQANEVIRYEPVVVHTGGRGDCLWSHKGGRSSLGKTPARSPSRTKHCCRARLRASVRLHFPVVH